MHTMDVTRAPKLLKRLGQAYGSEHRGRLTFLVILSTSEESVFRIMSIRSG